MPSNYNNNPTPVELNKNRVANALARATVFADENVEGYLKISKNVVLYGHMNEIQKGDLHPLTLITNDIVRIFDDMGFLHEYHLQSYS